MGKLPSENRRERMELQTERRRRKNKFEVGDTVEDLFTGNIVVIENITDVDGDRYADICPVHGDRDGYDTRAIPNDLQAL